MGVVVGAVVGLFEVGLTALVGGIAGLSLSTLGTVLIGGALAFGAAALNRSLLKAKSLDAVVGASSGSSGYSAQPLPQDVQQTIKQAVPSRRRHYGRVKVGGYIAFFDSVQGVFYNLIMCGQGKTQGFEEHWLNNFEVKLGPSDIIVGPSAPTGGTPFGSKIAIGTSTQYGFILPAPAHIRYVTIFPINFLGVTGASQGDDSFPVYGSDNNIGYAATGPYGSAFLGTITASLYGKLGSGPDVLLRTITFPNNLAPQFIENLNLAPFYDRVWVVLSAPVEVTAVIQGTGVIGYKGGVGLANIAVYSAGSLGAGSPVIATIAGGALDEDPFTTTNGSKTVVVSHPSHGLESGAKLAFSGMPDAVNGIPVSEFATNHAITKINADSYNVTMTTAATSAGVSGGATVRWRVTNDGSANPFNFNGVLRAFIETKDGSDSQEAFKELIDSFPNTWGVYHRLAGITCVLCRFQDVPQDDFSTVYPQGIPAYRAVLAAALVYDPRDETQDPDDDTTWKWSENAALVIFDFLTHPDGMGRPRSSFSAASFAAAADICDQTVLLKDGSSEPRYRIDASYDLTERPSTVLTRFLAACDGRLYSLPDGTWGLRVGKWYEPTVSISRADILEYSLAQGVDALARFNQLKLTYTDPLNDYQETEAQAWENESEIEAFGTLVDQLQLLEVPSPSQARRLGKIASAKSNPEWRGTIKTTLAGLAAMGEDIITITLDELEISTTFQVTGFQLAGDLSFCLLEVSSLVETAYEWDPATEEGTRPATASASVPLQVPDTPTGFAVLAGQIIVQGSTLAAAAKASWTTPSRTTLAHEIQYKLSSDTSWTSSAIPAGTTAWTSGVLNDGSSYDFRLRAVGPGGAPSGWSSTLTVVMTADVTAPAAPTALSSSHSGSIATVQWTNPTSSNFYATKIYRGTTSVFSSAAVVGTYYGGNGLTKTHQDTLAAGTYYWWAVAVNASGVASTTTGPTTQIIT